jgi:putative Mg2+ transporter-C (MgtC) family protein
MELDWEAAVRLVAALVLGATVGAEREIAAQPAGLRTHIAVCLGAALFGVISTLGFEDFFARRATTNVQVDVTRVASQVVVGIGFLGAGMIFRQGAAVKNLTTAASLWATSAIGLAVGVGSFFAATVTTVVLLGSLVLLRPLRTWINRRVTKAELDVRVVLSPGTEPASVVDALHRLDGVTVDELMLEKDAGRYVVVARLRAGTQVDLGDRLSSIARRDDVESAGEQVASD